MNSLKKDLQIQQLDPLKTLNPERFMDMEHEYAARRCDVAERIVNLIKKDNMEICDVGGCTGVLLDEIVQRSEFIISGTIFEIRDEYRTKLVRNDFHFIHSSIFDNELPDDIYDIVTFRHVLHHLVSDTVRATLQAQKMALVELLRVTKPGGYLVFEEEVNRIKPFSRIIYFLSKLTNRYRIHSKFFEMGKVVVSFMTPKEIHATINTIAEQIPLSVIEQSYVPWKLGWQWRLTLLHSYVGHVIYVVQKCSKE